jgi:hypothetical protein
MDRSRVPVSMAHARSLQHRLELMVEKPCLFEILPNRIIIGNSGLRALDSIAYGEIDWAPHEKG